MDRYIVRANVDHFIGLLNGGSLSPENRGMVMKLLIAEEDKLAHDLEHLEFIENRAARCRDRVKHFRGIRDGLADGSADQARADGVLANFEDLLALAEQNCRRMREKVNGRKL